MAKKKYFVRYKIVIGGWEPYRAAYVEDEKGREVCSQCSDRMAKKIASALNKQEKAKVA